HSLANVGAGAAIGGSDPWPRAKHAVIVIDASAVLEMLMNTAVGLRIAALVFAPDQTLHAPELIDVEIAQVVRRWVLLEELTEERALEALRDCTEMPLTRYAHAILLQRIWDLRNNLTAYDAAYVALAEAL